MKTIKIDITSDVVCPWCFVGKRRLEKAMDVIKKEYQGVKFEIKYLPYLLNPAYPFEGIEKEYAYATKFGAEMSKYKMAGMVETGKGEGIKFDFGGVVSNTLRAHSLSEFAIQHGKQVAIMEELFHNFFEERKNIGDIDTLVESAKKVGLDEGATREYLLDESNLLKVKKLLSNNQVYSINGVPHCVVQEKYEVPGAQTAEVFILLFKKILSEK